MGENIRLTASDGFELGGYISRPTGVTKGAIVVVQEIFGVNQHIREVTDRFADAGYVAVAPSIFDRQQRDFQCGYEGEKVDIARGFMANGNFDDYMRDAAAARDMLNGNKPIAVTGFCLGGSVAFAAATRLDGFACAIGYYGGKIMEMRNETPRCPLLLHFGEQDHSIPMDHVNAIREAQPNADIRTYDAQHGFNCDHRASYSEEHAKIAWQRTLAFMAKHMNA